MLTCGLCLKSFQYKQSLQDHLRGTHAIGGPIICSCGLTFNWRSTFKQHKKTCIVAKGLVDLNALKKVTSHLAAIKTNSSNSMQMPKEMFNNLSVFPNQELSQESDTSTNIPTSVQSPKLMSNIVASITPTANENNGSTYLPPKEAFKNFSVFPIPDLEFSHQSDNGQSSPNLAESSECVDNKSPEESNALDETSNNENPRPNEDFMKSEPK